MARAPSFSSTTLALANYPDFDDVGYGRWSSVFNEDKRVQSCRRRLSIPPRVLGPRSGNGGGPITTGATLSPGLLDGNGGHRVTFDSGLVELDSRIPASPDPIGYPSPDRSRRNRSQIGALIRSMLRSGCL